MSEASTTARWAISRLSSEWQTPKAIVKFDQKVRFHAGLGGRTSLLLAIGKAYSRWTGVKTTTKELARMLGRSGTSGVGLRASDGPGIVSDLGHRYPESKREFGPSSACLAQGIPAPGPVFRIPDGWRVILIRQAGVGISGHDEADFFQQHCPVPDLETQKILTLFSEALLPGLSKSDMQAIHTYLSGVQDLGLKAREWAIQSARALALRSTWRSVRDRDPRLSPLCLSSMGPTLFLLTEDVDRELRAIRDLCVAPSRYSVTFPSRSGVIVNHYPVRLD
jgi:beta-ribofuranosylaminobenzene 5'-phosphate synthase